MAKQTIRQIMRLPILLAVFFFLAPTANASGAIEKPVMAKLTKLASEKRLNDLRIVFTFEKDARICGGEGDAYIGQLEMNRYSRGYDENNMPKITDNWVKLDKTYTIFARELNEPNPQLFDPDACME